jgi:hypothetical protein
MDDNGIYYNRLSRAKNATGRREGYGRTEVRVNQGDSFGQWCRINDSAKQRLLKEFKDCSCVTGKANKAGLQATLQAERALPLEKPIHDEDADVEYFEDTQDRLPLGIEKTFNITMFKLEGPPGKVGEALKNNYKSVSRLPFGLPCSVDSFRSSPLAGAIQGSGFVSAISGQQFCLGTAATFAWVRFDIGDLNTFDHDLTGIPVIKDGTNGIIFPVTHLWVDLIGISLEWFLGKRCVAQKKLNLWFIPGSVLRGIISFAMRRLTDVNFDQTDSEAMQSTTASDKIAGA